MNSRIEFVCSLAESASLTCPANGNERSEPELRFNQVIEHLPYVILAEDTNESPAFGSELRPAVGSSQQVSERAVISRLPPVTLPADLLVAVLHTRCED
ncbi:hypothetical protein SOM70_37505 [Streptomyces salinarius]|uniref:hypothetical protein n=1 Tax=Streptomyces salinarius TaxID=2762598 RepID=UPI0032E0285D